MSRYRSNYSMMLFSTTFRSIIAITSNAMPDPAPGLNLIAHR